jgi:hypothetical protein
MSTEFKKAVGMLAEEQLRDQEDFIVWEKDKGPWRQRWLAGGSEGEGKASDGCVVQWSAPRHSTMTSFASTYSTSFFLLFISFQQLLLLQSMPLPTDITSTILCHFLRCFRPYPTRYKALRVKLVTLSPSGCDILVLLLRSIVYTHLLVVTTHHISIFCVIRSNSILDAYRWYPPTALQSFEWHSAVWWMDTYKTVIFL